MIIHSLRYPLLAKQIIESCSITHWDIANTFYKEIFSQDYKEWKDYEKQWRPIYLSTLEKVFPKGEVKSDYFLASLQETQDEAVEFTELRRVMKFKGAFEGQARFALLDIVKYKIELEQELFEEFPNFADLYREIKKRFIELIEEISTQFNNLTKQCQDWKTNKKPFSDAVKLLNTPNATVLYHMQKYQIEDVKSILISEKYRKWLVHTLFPDGGDPKSEVTDVNPVETVHAFK
jgi:hypothetical protein